MVGLWGESYFSANLKLLLDKPGGSPWLYKAAKNSFKPIQLMNKISMILNMINLIIGVVIEPSVRYIGGWELTNYGKNEYYKTLRYVLLLVDLLYRMGFALFLVFQIFYVAAQNVQKGMLAMNEVER